MEKALKEDYQPVWNNMLGVEPSALLGKIKKVPLVSDKIVAVAPIGLSGGFGFGAEGKATPASGAVPFERFETRSKDMYVNICISAKATRLTGNAGSMADGLKTEVTAAYDTAKWNVGRSLFGNGTGILTTFGAVAVAGNAIVCADVTHVKKGLIIDFYATGAAVGSTPAVAGRRVLDVNKATKTVTFGDNATTLAAGFITVQNSYGREITGLGTIFDSNITSIYGVTKAGNSYLAPIQVDAGGDIDDEVITSVLRDADRDKNSKIDTLFMGDGAYDKYVSYLRTNNQRIEDISRTITGGFKALRFIFGNREVDLVNEQFVPDEEIWGIESSKVEFHSQEWQFADLQGGGIFNLMENSSLYRALLANYGDMMITNPGGCVRIYNCK